MMTQEIYANAEKMTHNAQEPKNLLDLFVLRGLDLGKVESSLFHGPGSVQQMYDQAHTPRALETITCEQADHTVTVWTDDEIFCYEPLVGGAFHFSVIPRSPENYV